MPTRWSSAQVHALAPDASSLSGARGVSAAGKWTATGLHDELVWGLCRGSGAKPYQTCVDLSGPAFKCSCPSRKFPCKHALGLLMLWSATGLDEDAPAPDWVGEWQASRTAKAAAPRRSTAAPADPAAAGKRARQRDDRVAAGMAELRRWLDDQVQQGLAGAEKTGHLPYDAMAARLVDAQAPAAANAVRRLGTIAGIGPHWADRLLGELAMLRLLVAGHERLDTLPADLTASVRSRIGFPVTTDEVLAAPAVRDRWQALGQVETEDDKISTRSIWLRGRKTGRFGLLLSFAAPGQTFTVDVVPGSEFDADLHFYPGALPLRAVVGARHDTPGPRTTPTGAVPIRAALRGWSAALAAEPWRPVMPMLLADVVPTDDGHLVDAVGDALPLTPGHREPWWLLAAGGGTPATVAGEWSPDGFRPLSAWPDGRFTVASAAFTGGVGRSPELPTELLATALVGTARRGWTASSVRVGEHEVPVAGTDLLEAAAVALTYRRAATTPVPGRVPVGAAPAEQVLEVGAAATDRLRLILRDGGAPGGSQIAQELLAQWLSGAAERGDVVVAPDLLPALLDAGRRSTTIRPALARVAGERGRWLAGLRAEWSYLLAEIPGTVPATDPQVWETGSPGERVEFLTRVRRTDPDAARELLAASFADETPELRGRFVEVLATGLTSADDAFLELALDDRRKEVRHVALSLLRRLPGSAFGRRMAARATAAVRLDRRTFGADRIAVTAPTEIDAALRRDGVPARPPADAGVKAWLLEEIVAATPLDVWTTLFGRTPAAVIELAHVADWTGPLMHGWARAATAQRDARWATVLVATAERTGPGRRSALPQELAWDLHLVLPPVEVARFAAEALRDDPARAHRLLAVHPGEWPEGLATVVVENIAARARFDKHAWQLAELCRAAATAMPPRYAATMDTLATQLEHDTVDYTRIRPIAELATTLAFRRDMLQELTR